MKCYIGYTACRFVNLLIDAHLAWPNHSSALCWSQPSCYTDEDGNIGHLTQFLDLGRLVQSHRLRQGTRRISRPEEWSLSHPVTGHMNKHLLRMKYKRRAEGVELRYFA